MPERLDASSSAVENSNSVGSGLLSGVPFGFGFESRRGRAAGARAWRRAELDLERASWAARWRACSSAMRESMAPRIRWESESQHRRESHPRRTYLEHDRGSDGQQKRSRCREMDEQTDEQEERAMERQRDVRRTAQRRGGARATPGGSLHLVIIVPSWMIADTPAVSRWEPGTALPVV